MYSSHAQLNVASRLPKAEKIRRLLRFPNKKGPLRLLEIGTGAGVVASYFSKLEAPGFSVEAVDVMDQRLIHDGFAFQLYDGRDLPFPEASFDVVISNHVIEHVGNVDAQASHLAEIRRVLAPGGYAYLATPSRWQLVEPHFQLPFLGWLPKPLQDKYVRLAGKGEYYDCVLLRPMELRRLLTASGMSYENLNAKALHALIEVERPESRLLRILSSLPYGLLQAIQVAFPVMIYLLQKPPSVPAARE